MQKIVTIAERTARATALRKTAIEAAIAELRAYAAKEGGHYIVFGSAAKGLVSDHSDLDVIVDFPTAKEQAAFDFLEATCSKHQVPCDAQYLPSKETPFLKRVRDSGIMLP